MTVTRRCPDCGVNISTFREVQEGTTCYVCWVCKKVFRIYEWAEQTDGD